jgi:hypothetical protein
MVKKTFGLAIILGLLIFAAMVIAKPAPATMAKCPNIHKAVGALDAAMHDMEVAAHDFCGHKAEAMEATRHALEQLRKAEECKECR